MIHYEVQHMWSEHLNKFLPTQSGYDVIYWNEVLGAWVDAEDATTYPSEIIKCMALDSGESVSDYV